MFLSTNWTELKVVARESANIKYISLKDQYLIKFKDIDWEIYSTVMKAEEKSEEQLDFELFMNINQPMPIAKPA